MSADAKEHVKEVILLIYRKLAVPQPFSVQAGGHRRMKKIDGYLMKRKTGDLVVCFRGDKVLLAEAGLELNCVA